MSRLLLFVALAGGCASVHQVAVSDFEPLPTDQNMRPVMASATQKVVMGIRVDKTDYVEDAWDAIAAQCTEGEVRQITAVHSTRVGFFHWYNDVLMDGVCIGGPTVADFLPGPPSSELEVDEVLGG
jgi:hypothetical protein